MKNVGEFIVPIRYSEDFLLELLPVEMLRADHLDFDSSTLHERTTTIHPNVRYLDVKDLGD
jgi:hypothetical protein